MQAAKESGESAVSRTSSESLREKKIEIVRDSIVAISAAVSARQPAFEDFGVVVTFASVKNQSAHRQRLRI